MNIFTSPNIWQTLIYEGSDYHLTWSQKGTSQASLLGTNEVTKH